MSTALRKILHVLFLTVVSVPFGVSYAVIVSVVPVPPSQNVALGAASMVRVSWNVTSAAGPATTVFSTVGTLRAGIGGPVISTVPVRLSRAVAAGPGGTTVFRESVAIPERAVIVAQQQGFTQLSYERTFDDSGGPLVTGSATFNITGSAGAALSLSRIALRFPDNSRVKVMAKDATTHVLADLTFTGTGRLEAIWEIADPSSTQGNPSFRTLRLIRRQLIGSWQQLTLRSPELPTQASGLYLVRLRVTSPALSFESPVIRYFVNSATKPVPLPVSIRVLQPEEGKIIDASTRFEWSPVTGANVYQVEFRARAASTIAAQIPSMGEGHIGVPEEGEDTDDSRDSYPLAGIMVGASTQQLSLTALTFSRLTPGSSYWWRVLAYDAHGQLIGSGPLRAIVVPYSIRKPHVQLLPPSSVVPEPSAPAPDNSWTDRDP